MSKKLVFLAHNHHGSDGPAIPTKIGTLYENYFENKYGDQWIFRYDRDTKTISVHGGDCGWINGFQPIRLAVESMLEVKPDSITAQVLLAGKVVVTTPLLAGRGDTVAVFTMLLDENGQGINLNRGESMWLDACIEASGAEVPQKDTEWLREYVNQINSIGDELESD